MPHNMNSKQLIRFRTNRKEGFFDKVTGRVVIPPKYFAVRPFREGRALFYDPASELWGFLDEDGNEICPPSFMEAEDFSEGMAAVFDQKNERWGFIGPDGRFLIHPVFKNAHSFSEGLAPVLEKELWGYVSKDDRIEIGFQFDLVHSFSDGYAWVFQGDENYFIKKHGMKAINMDGYSIADSFSDGLAPLFDKENRSYSFIDTSPKFAITGLPYAFVLGFHDGLAGVCTEDRKKGFIDKSGKEVVPCIYDRADSFKDGLSLVSKDNKFGFLDKRGDIVVPIIYSDALNCEGGVGAVLGKRGEVLFFNEKGEEIEVSGME
jgi:hypothetical protein